MRIILLGFILLIAVPSFAVDVIVKETKAGLQVMTSQVEIDITKEPWKLVVKNSRGNLLFEEGEFAEGGNPPAPPATPLVYYLDSRVFAPLSYRVDKEKRGQVMGRTLERDTFGIQKIVGWSKAPEGVKLVCATDETDDVSEVSMNVEIKFVDEKTFHFKVSLSRSEGVWAFSELLRSQPDEQYFGLGEHFNTPNCRGYVRGTQPEYSPQSKSTHSKTHLITPFFISNQGYGIFSPLRRRAYFDMAASFEDRCRFIIDSEYLEFYVFTHDDPKEILKAYMKMTGMPPLYPRWVFAPHQWRNVVNEEEAFDDVKQMRHHNLPGSVIWIDNPWQTDYNNFEFDRKRFPDIEKLLGHMKNQGYKVALWSSEFVNLNTPEFAEGHNEGYLLNFDPKGTPFIMPWANGTGAPVDFHKPEAREWWKKRIRKCMEMGISGWKLDYGELEDGITAFRLPHLPGIAPRFYSGETKVLDVGSYRLGYHQTFNEVIQQEFGGDGFLICRTGAYGDQVNNPCIWPGDLDNDFGFHKDGIVGGLPAAISGGVSCGMVGFPYYGSDIGGFRKGTPTKESLIRWTQFGAFSPVMQLGGGGNHLPWDFNEFDQETLDIYRKYARFHTDLHPYLYTYVHEAHKTGMPIMRPLFLEYPKDVMACNSHYEYLFGEAFLVAPVYKDQARDRVVYLPEGQWVDYWSNQEHTGPVVIKVDAPIDILPLFVRKGSIIPMADPEIDTFAPAKDANVVTAEQREHHLIIRVYPDTHNEFTVYDGTQIQVSKNNGELELKVLNAPKAKVFTWQVVNQPAPQEIAGLTQLHSSDSLKKATEGWYYENNILYIKTSQTTLQIAN